MSSEHCYRSGTSQRQLRVGSAIQRAITTELLMDELLHSKFHMVSISGVRMQGGLKSAMILFTISNESKGKVKSVLSDLKNMTGYFRRIIANEIDLRYVPEISFEYDKAAVDIEILHENLRKINETSSD